MKTTLKVLALAGLVTASVAALTFRDPPQKRIFLAPGSQSDQADAGITIRGQVLYRGSGVPGARVKLSPVRPAKRSVLVTEPVIRQTETDAAGRFTLSGVPEGSSRLIVIADRLAPSITALEVRSGGPDLAVPLEAGVSLEGRVTSGDLAVAGARVSVRLAGPDSLLERRPLREGVTDADGRYSLEGLDADRPIRLVILAEGRRPFEKSFRTPLEGAAPIELEPGVQIRGRVVTSTGEPLPGASVQASQGEAYTSDTRSGDSGEVRLGGLVARPLTIRVFLEGFAPSSLELPAPSNDWSIVLRRNGGLAGRAPPGSWLVIESGGAIFKRGLGGDGQFRWEGLPPGPAEARAVDKTGRVLASRKVEIPEGEVAGGMLLAP